MFSFIFSLVALASPSPTPTPPPTEVQKIRQVIQDEVIKKINQLRTTSPDSPVNPKFCFHGQVTLVDQNALTLDVGNSTTQPLTYQPHQITIIDPSRNKIGISQINIGDEVLALGNRLLDPNGYELRRLIVIKPGSIKRPLPLIIGKITDISTTSNLFTLSTTGLKHDFQIKYQGQTPILSTTNSQKLKTSQLAVGQIVAVVPDPKTKSNTNNSATAITIYITNFSSPSPTPKR